MKSDSVRIQDFDETFCIVSSEDLGIISELNDYFSFMHPNYKFTPAYINKVWDGKIRLYQQLTGRLYKGLIPYVEKFAKDRSYPIVKDDSLTKKEVNKFDTETFLKSLGLKLDPYPEQKIALSHAIENERCLLLSPTASGKSLIQYALTRYYFERVEKKILICVPTISLVHQMKSDFKEYSDTFDVDANVHTIYEGQEKLSDKRIIISTWQSIYKLHKRFFEQFDVIIIDEAHTMKSDSLKGILEKASNTKYRIGLTGTLDDMECNKLTIEGLTGTSFVVTTTKDLMDQGRISKLEILCSVLNYSQHDSDIIKKFSYQEEMSFIINHPERLKFISKMVNFIPEDKNILILTAYKNHVKNIHEELKKSTNKKILCVSGDVDSLERERIRKLAENENNLVIIATYGVYSTGVNIRNLQYLMNASPSKSVIRVLQSIGRGLRKDGKTNSLKVIDIVDKFQLKSRKNFLFLHFIERVKIYVKQRFSYKIKYINI